MQKVLHFARRRLAPLLPAGLRRRFMRAYWDSRWRLDDPAIPWLDRDVSAEIVAAVDEGWFAAGVPAIDLGCGRGDVAAWLAGRGFPSVGVDIAPSAIALARRTHREQKGRLEYLAVDVCADALPDTRFGVLVDRGCFHQLDVHDREAYARKLAFAAAPHARFLLFVKAFREGQPAGDPVERERATQMVEQTFSFAFLIERVGETTLNRPGTLPGLVFWMTRKDE